jgi:hypothetical protein
MRHDTANASKGSSPKEFTAVKPEESPTKPWNAKEPLGLVLTPGNDAQEKLQQKINIDLVPTAIEAPERVSINSSNKLLP